MRLSHRDFELLQQAILDLYEFRDLDAFRAAAPRIFLRAIPSLTWVWPEYRIEPETRRVSLVQCAASEREIRSFMMRVGPVQLLGHPFMQHTLKGGGHTPMILSDFLSVRQFRETPTYLDGHRTFGADREMAVMVRPQNPRTFAAVSFCRRGGDFSERDRLLLHLLRPHFEQAHSNAELASTWMNGRVAPQPRYHLTPRESEIATWLAQGKTNAEIALILNARPRTIEKHVERILEKLGVENRTAAAVTLAAANGAAGH